MADLTALLLKEGYRSIKAMPDGMICGLQRQLFTTGLIVGLSADGYQRRYCYEHENDAARALAAWDGADDPSGPWIKEKPSDRIGPGATND